MIPADVVKDLQEGRLSQRCPKCLSVVEAAGGYSTCHNVPTGPADWFRQKASNAQRAHLDRARAIQSGGDRPQHGAEQEKTAPPAILARAPATVTEGAHHASR